MDWKQRLIEYLDRNCGWTDEERAGVVAERLIEAGVAREITTCGECAYCEMEDEYERWCIGWGSPARLVRPDDFCSKSKQIPKKANG